MLRFMIGSCGVDDLTKWIFFDEEGDSFVMIPKMTSYFIDVTFSEKCGNSQLNSNLHWMLIRK